MPTTCKLIAKNVLGSDTASVTFSSIPGTYSDLLIVASARSSSSDQGTQSLLLRFNSDTGSNYSQRRLYGEAGSASSDSSASRTNITVVANGGTSTSSTFAASEIYIPNYAGSTNKSVSHTGASEANATNASAGIYAVAGLWSSTAAITALSLTANGSDSIKSGSSFFLYGITKSA